MGPWGIAGAVFAVLAVASTSPHFPWDLNGTALMLMAGLGWFLDHRDRRARHPADRKGTIT